MSRKGSLFTALVNAEPDSQSQASVDSHQPDSQTSRIPDTVPSHTVANPPSRPVESRSSHEAALLASHMEASPERSVEASQGGTVADIRFDRVARELATEPKVVERPRAKRGLVDSQRREVVARHGDRHRPTRTAFNNRLDPELVKRIKHFCIEHRLEQQEFVELAASQFMDTVESQEKDGGAIVIAPDQKRLMMKYKTDPTIINLYMHYNPENKWKPADDRAAEKYNMVDIRQIELAFIHTQFNARFKRINSFSYYIPELEANLEVPLSGETLDIMLKQHKRRWQEAKGA